MLYNTEISILKFSEPTFIKGIHQDGVLLNTRQVSASVQPITGRDVYNLPEGWAERIRFKVYIDIVQQLTMTDKIKYNGKTYKILMDNSWNASPFLTHSKIFLAECDA